MGIAARALPAACAYIALSDQFFSSPSPGRDLALVAAGTCLLYPVCPKDLMKTSLV